MFARYPLTGPQYNFWIDQKINPSSSIYNIGGYADIHGKVNYELFEKSVNSLVRDNDSLRIRFSNDDNGNPYQYFSEYKKFNLHIRDFSNEKNAEKEAKSWISHQFKIPYKLDDNVLYDLQLIKVSEEHYLYYFKYHHMIIDGWGTLAAVKQVVDRYNNDDDGLPCPSYINFIENEESYRKSSRFKKSEAFWKEKFKSAPESILSTPLFNMPKDPHGESKRNSISLSASLYKKLNDISSDQGVTIFSVMLASIFTLLNKITRLESIVIGVPLLNRSSKEFKNTIGLFVETSPLVANFTPKLTFKELIHQVKLELAECYRHQRYPAGSIAQLANTNSFSRLLDVSVSFEKHTDNKSLSNYKTEMVAVSSAEQNNALSIYIREYHAGEDVVIDFDARPDVFNDYSVDRLVKHFQCLVDSIVKNPNSTLSELNILSDYELSTLHGFNHVLDINSSKETMISLFENQVKKTPDHKALICGDKVLTYRELNSHANAIADYLLKNTSICNDQIIGVMLDRSERMVISILAVLKSGGAYVPIDPEYPEDRIEYMLEDSKPALLITQEALTSKISDNVDVPIINFEFFDGLADKLSNVDIDIDPKSLAYVIYTSGSTGKPKGVMIEHASVCNISKAWRLKYQLNEPGFSLLQIASFSFDVATGDIVRSLHNGGAMVITEKDDLLDPDAFYCLIKENNVSILEGTPKLLIPTFSYFKEQGKNISFLHTVILGSDAVTKEDFVKVRSYLGSGQKLFNSYGVTESTIDSTCYEYVSDEAITTAIVPIGSPLLNNQLHIVDEEFRPVPIGVPGELCIAGLGLARGYLNNKDLTEEKFIDNPFSKGERIYRTGDMARWLADGNVDFIGRLDDQVKIRGYRIELGEIENSCQSITGIKSCVVAVKTPPSGDKFLAAYYVKDNVESTIDAVTIKQSLFDMLPAYMVPSAYLEVDSIPLTPNGKVNRKSLPEVQLGASQTMSTYQPPSTFVQSEIAHIWQKILEVECVSLNDNFFDLGGHSLKAVSVINLINNKFSCNLSLKDIFECADLLSLSTRVERDHEFYDHVIPVVENADSYDVSHAQKRLWLLDKLNGGALTYAMPGVFWLDGPLDVLVFESSIKKILNRHEILRTVFVEVDGEPKQTVLEDIEGVFEFEDVSSFDLPESKAKNVAENDLSVPFELDCGPLLRLKILKVREIKHLLVFNMHHIISDGWSLQVFLNDLLELYKYSLSGDEENCFNKTKKLDIQYKDFSNWQNSILSSKAFDRHKRYWMEEFKDEPSGLDMPSDFPRPIRQTFNGETLDFLIDKSLSSGLMDLGRKNNASLFMVLQSLLKVLLFRYTGQSDITLGTVVSGRTHPMLQEQIGLYANTLALRDNLAASMSFEDVLSNVRTTSLNAYEHQDYPFDKLIEDLNVKRDLSRSPLFDIAIVLQKAKDDTEIFTDIVMESCKHEASISKFDMTFDFVESGSEILCTIEFNTDIYKRLRIERLANHYEVLAQSILSSPEKRISDLTILSDDERRTVLSAPNHEPRFDKCKKTIVELFEEQAKKTPNNCAISFSGNNTSYRELNQKSNAIAEFLRVNYSLKPNDFVGLLIPRSDSVFVAMMGVMKSGAAYIPIDPTYPRDRINYMLNDASPKLIICQTSSPVNSSSEVDSILTGAIPSISIDELLSLPAKIDNLPCINHYRDLSYVIYTSGSTGKPKGTLIEHKGATHFALSLIRDYQITENDGLLQFASASFDASVFEMLTAWFSGAKLAIPTESELKNPDQFGPYIIRENATVTLLPPAFLKNQNEQFIRHFRVLLTGGDKTNPTDVAKYKDEVDFYNAYGPTETTVITCSHRVEGDIDLSKEVPIGKAIDYARFYVVDSHRQLQPFGIPGELCISGMGLARGYLNQPQLTAEKFIDNPFSDEKDYDRIYRTGDLVVMNDDGNIEHLGRIDSQVKVRGYRIELGEIQNRLMQYDGINNSTVLAVDEGEGDKSLVAYFSANEVIETSVIKSYLDQFLAGFMIPSKFIQLDHLPVTPNGKLDNKRLISIAKEYSMNTSEYVAPRTELEKLLCEIWTNVLRQSAEIGIDDSFFELGGDSIKAIQVLAKLTQSGYSGEISQLFEMPTIRQFSPTLSLSKKVNNQDKVVGKVCLSPIQKWFLEDLDGPKNHFNQSVMLSLKEGSSVSDKMIMASIESILDHHDALRVHYPIIDGRREQVVRETVTPYFESHDLVSITEDEGSSVKYYAESLQKSFSLSDDVLIKFARFHLKNESLLLVVAHHLIIDGISWRVLIEDLQLLIDQQKNNQVVELPNKTVSIESWNKALFDYSQSDEIQKEISYWSSLYFSNKVLCPSCNGTHDDGVKISTFFLDKNETEVLLKKSVKAFNTSVNDILVTALVRTLKLWANSDLPVSFDFESYGRSEKFNLDVSRTIAWFTAVYPVVFDVHESLSMDDQLITVKEILRSVPNNGVGYGVLKYLYTKDNFTPIDNEISFNYLGQFDAGDNDSLLTLSDYSAGSNVDANIRSPYKLNFNGIVRDGVFNMTLDSHFYAEEELDKIQDIFKEQIYLLNNCCLSASESIKTPSDFTLPHLSMDDYSVLLEKNGFSKTAIDNIYPLTPLQEGLLFHALVEPESSVYFEQISMELEGDLDVLSFERAWQELANRHSVFRTSFCTDLGEPLQVVHKKREINFSYEDLRGATSTSISEIKRNDRKNLFDLRVDPLCRVKILQTDDNFYTLILSFHHIILDGWCTSLMFKEVLDYYENYQKGNDSFFIQSKKLSIPQYSSYISWLTKQDSNQSRLFWRKYLQGYEQIASLPKDEIVGDVDAENHKYRRLLVDADKTDKIKLKASNVGVTINTVIQAIWGVLLATYNQTDDVVFGSTVSGRPQDVPRVEEIIGLFINTIPVRVNLDDSLTLIDLVKNLQADALKALPYHYSSLADIQSDSGLNGGLLDHIIVFENYPVDASITEGSDNKLTVKNFEAYELTNFDFGIVVFPTNTLEIDFHYSPATFCDRRIEQVRDHFKNLLDVFVCDKDIPINKLSLMTVPETRLLIEQCNQTQRDYPRDLSVADMFELQAQKTPAAIALIDNDVTLSYDDLNQQANKLACFLQKKYALKAEVRVAICLPRSIDLMVAVLGILKSGAAYVPLDLDYPVDRIHYILKDAKPTLILSDNNFTLKNIDLPIVDVNEIDRQDLLTSNPYRDSDGNSLAYIIYTSGSTGKPKGVMLENRGVVNLITSHIEYFNYQPEERSLQFSSICFDASIEQIWVSLLSGGGVVLVSKDTILSEKAFNQYIYDKKVTYIDINPSYLENIDLSLNPYLKRIVVGGEKCPVHIAKKYADKISFYNFYGPTETTVSSLRYKIDGSITDDTKVPIGSPVANTRVYILDRHQKLLPQGVDGEIYIAGDGLARGYVNDDKLTREKFLDDPFYPGEKMYASGDLGHWTYDGVLEFSGRIDDQIKVRGYRIEPGEVEKAMLLHDSVDSAFVYGRSNNSGGNDLIAYYTTVKGCTEGLDPAVLRHALSLHLPEYMVPDYITPLDYVPLTANGKIDKRALPEPAQNCVSGRVYAPPVNEVQKRLLTIWQHVLDVSKIGIHDDFFALGGHSLKAMQITSLINKEFDIDFPLNTLFMVSSISGVAEVIESGSDERSSNIVIPLQVNKSINAVDPLFLVPGAVGDVLYYTPLAQALAKKRSVYGFASVGLDGNGSPIDSIEEMAQCYIKEMKSIQPVGPYFIGGHSFGGIVAFEMARQLEGAGEMLGALYIMDTLSPKYTNELKFSEQQSMPWLVNTVANLHDQTLNADLDLLISLPDDERWIELEKIFSEQNIELSVSMLRNMWNVYKTNSCMQYLPKAPLQSGRVVLIKSQESADAELPQTHIPVDFGWQENLLHSPDMYTVKGGHESMLREPFVQELVDLLQANLASSEQPVTGLDQ